MAVVLSDPSSFFQPSLANGVLTIATRACNAKLHWPNFQRVSGAAALLQQWTKSLLLLICCVIFSRFAITWAAYSREKREKRKSIERKGKMESGGRSFDKFVGQQTRRKLQWNTTMYFRNVRTSSSANDGQRDVMSHSGPWDSRGICSNKWLWYYFRMGWPNNVTHYRTPSGDSSWPGGKS